MRLGVRRGQVARRARRGRTRSHLSFEVTDDGRGFDPAATAHGTGLQGMADRLEALGGSIEVRSRPGQGTTIAGRIPI
jgi:two-component system sensor histidine kinase UhpB